MKRIHDGSGAKMRNKNRSECMYICKGRMNRNWEMVMAATPKNNCMSIHTSHSVLCFSKNAKEKRLSQATFAILLALSY